MVKILKAGHLPGDAVFSGKCTRCKCEIEFQAREATYNNDQRDGDYYSIICPTPMCAATITAAVRSGRHDE